MDSTTAQQYIEPVEEAVTEAENEANSVSDPTLRAQIVNATGELRKAVDSWETDQLQLVESGAKPDDWWIKYGTDETDSGSLISQAKRFVRDNGAFYAQWSKEIEAAGQGAQDVISFVTEHIQDWQTAIEGYKEKLATYQTNEQSIQGIASLFAQHPDVTLPADLHDLLFGAAAQTAANNLTDMQKLCDLGDELLAKMQAGATFVFSGGDVKLAEAEGLAPTTSSEQPGDLSQYATPAAPESDYSGDQSTDETSGGQSIDESGGQSVEGIVQVGQTAVLTSGVVITGMVTLIALLGTISLAIDAYQSLTMKRLQSADTQKEIDFLSNPNVSEADKQAFEKHQDDLAKNPPPDPFKSLMEKIEAAAETIALGVAGLVAVGFGWRYRKEIEAWIKKTFGRKTNPRKRHKARRYA